MSKTVVALGCLVFSLAACSASPRPETSQTEPQQQAPAAPAESATESAATTAPASAPADSPAAPAASKPESNPEFDPALLRPSSLRATAPGEYQAKFETTQGDFIVQVTRAWAPVGADRFYNLVRNHFYDGASFFRVLPGFVVQFGLSPYPQLSRVWADANIKDDPVVQSNHRGFLTYAMAGPNTRTTQIFINLGNNERLDGMGFAAFGAITDGMEVVDKLYSGYGEGAPDGRGPSQELIQTRGRAYLQQGFPRLDSIKTATIVPAK